MRTLLQVTMPPLAADEYDDDVGGPEVILCCKLCFCVLDASSSLTPLESIFFRIDKTRSLEFEEPFFQTLGHYFRMTPLLHRTLSAEGEPSPTPTTVASRHEDTWSRHGVTDDVYTLICRRWRHTLGPDWAIPQKDSDLMNGNKATRCTSTDDGLEHCVEGADTAGANTTMLESRNRDRTWGWVEGQLGAIEWD